MSGCIDNRITISCDVGINNGGTWCRWGKVECCKLLRKVGLDLLLHLEHGICLLLLCLDQGIGLALFELLLHLHHCSNLVGYIWSIVGSLILVVSHVGWFAFWRHVEAKVGATTFGFWPTRELL